MTLLITLDELKEHLPLREGNTQFDEILEGAIEAATEQIESLCGQKFGKDQRTDYFDTRGSSQYRLDLFGVSEEGYYKDTIEQFFYLSSVPVDLAQEAEVRYDPQRVWGEDTIVPQSRYHIDPVRGKLYLRWPTSDARRSLKVTYTGGYEPQDTANAAASTIPASLRTACIIQSIYLWKRLQAANVGVADERVQSKGSAIKYFAKGAVAPEVPGLIREWRRLRIGGL